MDNKIKIFIGVIIVLVVGVSAAAFFRSSATPPGPGVYDEFASCLSEKGAVFYGAFWCPHCQAQKKMFGSSQKLLPYVECSTADGRSQLPACMEKNVTSYPTWEFADGTRLTGEISLAQLSEKTGCVLPGSSSEAAPASSSEGEATAVPQ